MVQQGEPQDILLHPNDPYIVDFISDINRARVLRVRSIMMAFGSDLDGSIVGDVGAEDTLESVIARSGGDTDQNFRVMIDGAAVGVVSMRSLVRALVPLGASAGGMRSKAS